jgi:hypothetical protein
MSELNFGDAIKAFLDRSKLKSGVQAMQLTDTWEKDNGKNHCPLY